MKKILGLAVAVAFAITATAVIATEAKKSEPAKPAPVVEKVKITEKTTAPGKVEEKVKAVEKTPGVKEEIKITEKVDVDVKTICLKKYPGKTLADKEVSDCIAAETAKAKEAPKVALEKKATTGTAAPATTTAKPLAPAAAKPAEKKN